MVCYEREECIPNILISKTEPISSASVLALLPKNQCPVWTMRVFLVAWTVREREKSRGESELECGGLELERRFRCTAVTIVLSRSISTRQENAAAAAAAKFITEG